MIMYKTSMLIIGVSIVALAIVEWRRVKRETGNSLYKVIGCVGAAVITVACQLV